VSPRILRDVQLTRSHLKYCSNLIFFAKLLTFLRLLNFTLLGACVLSFTSNRRPINAQWWWWWCLLTNLSIHRNTKYSTRQSNCWMLTAATEAGKSSLYSNRHRLLAVVPNSLQAVPTSEAKPQKSPNLDILSLCGPPNRCGNTCAVPVCLPVCRESYTH